MRISDWSSDVCSSDLVRLWRTYQPERPDFSRIEFQDQSRQEKGTDATYRRAYGCQDGGRASIHANGGGAAVVLAHQLHAAHRSNTSVVQRPGSAHSCHDVLGYRLVLP